MTLTLDSRSPGATTPGRTYHRLRSIVQEVNEARVLAGFHFYRSDVEGSDLGQRVSRHVTRHLFQPTRRGKGDEHRPGPG